MRKTLLFACTILTAMPALAEVPAPPVEANPVALEALNTMPTPLEATPQIEAPKPFLQALISAYNTNPRLKAAREELKAVDEGVATALSGFRPSASAEYSKGRQRSRSTADWGYNDSRSRGATISQPLFRGGRTIYGYQGAKQAVKSARAALQLTEQDIILAAVDTYSEVFEKQSVLELSQNNANVLNEQLEATRARFDVGELTRTDVAQAEARYAQSIAELQQAEGNLKTAKATFQKIVGYAPENLLPDSVIPELPVTLSNAIAIADAHNPALLAAKHNKKAAGYGVDQAVGSILPEVSLNGSLNRSSGSGFFGKFDNDALTLNLSVPLYQSGAEYSRVREAKNRHQQSKYMEVDMKNEVTESVTRAFEDYRTSLSVIQSTAAAVEAADIARAGVHEENQFGVRTILDVLDAEQEVFRNRVNLVRAERTKTTQAYRLLASIGKLTAENLGLPVDIYDPKAHYNDVKWLPIGF